MAEDQRAKLQSWLAAQPEMISRAVAESIALDYADITTRALQAEIDRLTKKPEPPCWCHGCAPEFDPDLPFSMNFRGMVLCPDCGNKRCPKANHHDNACTGSNDTGQPGSAYQ